jgi:hypothetical protein
VIPKVNGLYKVISEAEEAHAANTKPQKHTLADLHRRMAHIAPYAAKRLIQDGSFTGIELDLSSPEPTFCESCVHAKMKRAPAGREREGERAENLGDLVHTDVWGPSGLESIHGHKYFNTCTDDSKAHTHLYLLRAKSQTFPAYKQFEAWAAH